MRRSREETSELLLDATERLLVREGITALSTRRVAEEAGINHGLVHYSFASMGELALRTAQRATSRLIIRQREMYEGPGTFLDKWRTAMGFLDEDIKAGYPKLMFELSALAWNDPLLAAAIADMDAQWRAVLTDAVTAALEEYGLDPKDYPVEPLVTLIATFNLGIESERLLGVSTGHDALLAWIDQWLSGLQHNAAASSDRRGSRGRTRTRT
jgi:AcrR family transcriptional regulator